MLGRYLVIFTPITTALIFCVPSTSVCQSSSHVRNSQHAKAQTVGTRNPQSHCGSAKTILGNIIDVELAAEPASRKYGVDPALLLALFWYESKWDPGVKGCSGERGLGQFMPATVKTLGIQNVHDIKESSEKGAQYLHYLLNEYSKDSDSVGLALAAWNVGERDVNTCSRRNKFNVIIHQGSTKPCVPPDEWYKTNRPTTYVKTVKGYLSVTQKLVDYLDTAGDPSKASLTLQRQADLEAAFGKITVRDRTIASLNAQINAFTEQIASLKSQLKAENSREAAIRAQQQIAHDSARIGSQIDRLAQSDPSSANDANILHRNLHSATSSVLRWTTKAFTLSPQFSSREIVQFELGERWNVEIEASWQGDTRLALILNGPCGGGAYARKDGGSPLLVEYPVTPEDLVCGNEWRASIVNFSGKGPVSGFVRVITPDTSLSEPEGAFLRSSTAPSARGPIKGSEDPHQEEECVSFDPARVEAVQSCPRCPYDVEEPGKAPLEVFSSAEESRKAIDTIKYYSLNRKCFVGGPTARYPMKYYLSEGASAAPSGAFPGEDAVPISPENLIILYRPLLKANIWWVIDDRSSYLAFENETDAQKAIRIIKKYGFRFQCFVDRPQRNAMMYFRK